MCECYLVFGGVELFTFPFYYIGQTFTPTETHKLEFIDLSIKRHTIGGEILVKIFDLEKDPDMIGGGISSSRYFNVERGSFWEWRRARVRMHTRYLQEGKAYGLTIRHTPVPAWNKYAFEYGIHASGYPRGMRFTKDSWFAPPTYYPNEDMIFAEFGTPVAKPIPPDPAPWPPPAPPDPTIEQWCIIQGAQRRTETGERMIAYTNVPCHLWLRWTVVKPRTHTKSKRTRGLLAMTDLYFCFDVFTDYEQQEPGDTLEHNFIVEPWPYCELRYFYFHGTVNGTSSPSTSPIFTKHPIFRGHRHIYTCWVPSSNAPALSAPTSIYACVTSCPESHGDCKGNTARFTFTSRSLVTLVPKLRYTEYADFSAGHVHSIQEPSWDTRVDGVQWPVLYPSVDSQCALGHHNCRLTYNKRPHATAAHLITCNTSEPVGDAMGEHYHYIAGYAGEQGRETDFKPVDVKFVQAFATCPLDHADCLGIPSAAAETYFYQVFGDWIGNTGGAET